MKSPAALAKDKRVFEETLKSARLGLPEAQYEVGLMYANGIGTAQNIAQAVDWIKQAAKQGLASAQFLLATRYEAGVGVEPSAHQALVWFAKAADQGHLKAVFRMGKLLSQPHAQDAREAFRHVAEAGPGEMVGEDQRLVGGQHVQHLLRDHRGMLRNAHDAAFLQKSLQMEL